MEIIEPIVFKSLKDREMIYKMEKDDVKILDRINLLEMAVYQQESNTGRTLFDDFQDKILELSIEINGQKTEIMADFKGKTNELNSKLFDLNQKVSKVELHEEIIDANKTAMERSMDYTKN